MTDLSVVPEPSAVTGLWRCETPKGCERAQTRATFPGPSQSDAQRSDEPIRCPDCGGTLIMYAGDQEVAKDQKEADNAA